MAASLAHALALSASPPNPNARGPSPRASLRRLPSPFPRRRLTSPIPALSIHPLFAGGDAIRLRRLVAAFAASNEEPRDTKFDGDNAKDKDEIKPEEAQEAWKETLEQFKAEVLRMQALTMHAYGVYSKKAMKVLMETSEKLRIQADKAHKDLSVIAADVGVEGQEYLKMAAQNSPDSVRDITETFRSLGDRNGLSDYEDYHVGIPFGTLLTVGGFLSFMLTGSISAIRFGFFLGLALLALSISSLRSQRVGRQSLLLLKGQAAIAIVIFLRQLLIFSQNGWLPTIFSVVVSGLVAAFYVYRIMTGAHSDPRIESGSKN